MARADYVADRRAPTPSAAAEIVAPDVRDLGGYVAGFASRIDEIIGRSVRDSRSQFELAIDRMNMRVPDTTQPRQRIDDLLTRARLAGRRRLPANHVRRRVQASEEVARFRSSRSRAVRAAAKWSGSAQSHGSPRARRFGRRSGAERNPDSGPAQRPLVGTRAGPFDRPKSLSAMGLILRLRIVGRGLSWYLARPRSAAARSLFDASERPPCPVRTWICSSGSSRKHSAPHN